MITDAPSIYPVYVDESFGPDHPALCVAGYIFTPERAKEMSAKWAAILASKALPHFHMGACNGGYDEFAHLDDDERDAVARRMIALTREYAEFGFGISVSPVDYLEVFPEQLRAETGTPYTFCLRHCMTMTKRWAEKTGFDGRFAFFFENGHEHAPEAAAILAEYRESERLTKKFRIYSHTFLAKGDAEPLQAADILAWHFYVNYRRVAEGKPSRLDFVALLREHDSKLELTRERLVEMAPLLMQAGRTPTSSFSSGEGSSGAMPQ